MVRIDRIISVTVGRFHCWVESPVGLIRKPNAAVPQDLWDIFEGRKEAPKVAEIIIKPKKESLWSRIKKMFWKIFGIRH